MVMFHYWNMTAFSDFDGLALFTRIVQAGSLAAAKRATGIPKGRWRIILRCEHPDISMTFLR